jgi:hypothetical protein
MNVVDFAGQKLFQTKCWTFEQSSQPLERMFVKRPVRNAHRVPTFVGPNRERIRLGESREVLGTAHRFLSSLTTLPLTGKVN